MKKVDRAVLAIRKERAAMAARHARLMTRAAVTFGLVLRRNLFAWEHDPLESALFLVKVWLQHQEEGPGATATEIVAIDEPEDAAALLGKKLEFSSDLTVELGRRLQKAVADVSIVYYEQCRAYRGLWSIYLLAQIARLARIGLSGLCVEGRGPGR